MTTLELSPEELEIAKEATDNYVVKQIKADNMNYFEFAKSLVRGHSPKTKAAIELGMKLSVMGRRREEL